MGGPANALAEEGLGYLAMAAHSDPRVSLSRFNQQPTRFFAITRSGAID